MLVFAEMTLLWFTSLDFADIFNLSNGSFVLKTSIHSFQPSQLYLYVASVYNQEGLIVNIVLQMKAQHLSNSALMLYNSSTVGNHVGSIAIGLNQKVTIALNFLLKTRYLFVARFWTTFYLSFYWTKYCAFQNRLESIFPMGRRCHFIFYLFVLYFSVCSSFHHTQNPAGELI